MIANDGRRKTILDRQVIDGVTLGEAVIIEPYAVIYEGCEIGDHTVIGAHAVLRPRTKVGNFSIFGTHSVSEGDNNIGSASTVHAQCHITSKLTIGDNVFIGPMFCSPNTPDITNGFHGTHPDRKTPDIKNGTIEDNVRIGTRVTITPGIRIGHHSLIYQNTLVTKDVEPYSVVKGGKDQVGRKI